MTYIEIRINMNKSNLTKLYLNFLFFICLSNLCLIELNSIKSRNKFFYDYGIVPS